MSKSINRRDFLFSSARLSSLAMFASALPISILSEIARAQTQSRSSRNLLFIRVNGALDSLQGLNPWTDPAPAIKDLSMAYNPLSNGTVGDYESVLRNVHGTQINLGPSAHGLARHASKIAVVNGIWMGPTDLGHPFAIQYMTSGRAQERAPHLSAIVGNSRHGDHQFTVINGPIEKGDEDPKERLKIMQTVNLKEGLSGGSGGGASGFISAYRPGSAHIDSYQSFVRKKDVIEGFNAALNEMKPKEMPQQSSSGGITPRILEFSENELEDISAIAALASGLSSIVQLDWSVDEGGNLDNHILYKEIHPAAQRNRWDRLARLLDRMEKYNLLQNTLVVVVTEFSRTPAFNSNGGKDHNYSDNSALLIGAGINGGMTLGGHRLFGTEGDRSESQLSGDYIDFAGGTGEIFRLNKNPKLTTLRDVPRGFNLIRPPDILKTALDIVQPGLGDLLGDKAKVLPKIVAES